MKLARSLSFLKVTVEIRCSGFSKVGIHMSSPKTHYATNLDLQLGAVSIGIVPKKLWTQRGKFV